MVGRQLAVLGMGTFSLSLFKVKAQSSEGQTEVTAKTSNMVKVKDLPIYGEPKAAEFQYITEKDTVFRNGVSDIRKTIWEAATMFEDSWKKLVNVGGGVRDYCKDTVKYIQEDSTVLQRASVITVAGLGGVVAGYRGGVLRKATLASVGMVTAASICYPNQAVDISSRGWDTVKHQGKDMWSQTTRQKPANIIRKSEPATENKDKLTTAHDGTMNVDQSKMDFGQSKVEDKDMYTTRGS